MEFLVNYWAVLVAAIAAYAVGAIWYSPVLFSSIWAAELKRAPGQMVGAGFTAPVAMIYEFISTFVMTYVLANIILFTDANTASLAIIIGIWLWVGFIAMHAISGVWFEGRSWRLFAISTGHRLVAILGVWH